ncbi:uncharacterized protein E0L32_011111 [Thyridium curvatum]|uniref:Uncharacterized protein n=1 Tax=Thyridium curvatum TaxID=1093900 RepID=A0A507AKS5_9PEZI|nr:uncharacterized protein E0L32_011111 [Thyridium curvatum]TPX06966.1 hypothetical protein E0L32_011111 [Thyridium curvatum]
MAARCSSSVPFFLPFLYPSLVRSTARSAAPRISTAFRQVRRHMSEAQPPPQATRLDPTPDDYAISTFADKAQLTVYAGAGGHGCISFLRELYLAEGPANGGDGGHGGNIYIQAVHGETSLHKLARRRYIRAERGRHGQGSAKNGRRGEDVILTVPVGTVVKEISRDDPETEQVALVQAARRREIAHRDSEEEDDDLPDLEDNHFRQKWLLYPGMSKSDAKSIELPRLPRRQRLYAQPAAPVHLDLSKPTQRPILLAAGGVGGLGNPHFVSKKTPRPMFATKGEKAMSMTLELELKLLADVGLVGLPNAGKSTLLRAISNSRARVGSWAFTTLQPNIGTVVLDNNRGRPIFKSYRRESDESSGVVGEEDPEVVQRTRFTVADIPGLIEGAHLDKGLGIAFLRHVERAGVLAFVIDLSAGNAVKALNALWNEVGLYAQMREDEERDRERDARIEWSDSTDSNPASSWMPGTMTVADYPTPPESVSGLHIAAKPWFVVATKGDLPNTQENFKGLREYLAGITRGDLPHPSGIEGAWTKDCAAIPVSAINGQGVDRIVHWTSSKKMGRGKFRGKGRGGRGGGGRSGGGGRDRPGYTNYQAIVKEHERLERYYNGLLGLDDGPEKQAFWEALRRELPNSFRFCGSKGHALAVKRLLQTRYIPEITKITHTDGQAVEPPKPVPWYPDNLAWDMTTPKNIVRRFPPFAAFQKFLVSETSVGNISRQEVVSMIPPLLLDVRPGMAVLDMCAAPGSKAAQLLEMVHQGEEGRIRKFLQQFAREEGLEVPEIAAANDNVDMDADPSDDGRATGLLIANDADYKRSHMLIHQLKRLSSPNMIVTNHDATLFPSLRLPSDDPKAGKYLKFDRILADVPCSGDGTLRKNIAVWREWQPGSALGLHLTQTRILVRALQMLKPGGRVVYSTCSMNPVENEAVIAAAIDRCGGLEKIDIVDCSSELPKLQRRPGMTEWQVMDKSARLWNNWQEVEEYTKASADGIAPGKVLDTMFAPPRKGDGTDIPLERCMRVYAHLQDTGAFFITVLEKKAEFKARPEESRKAAPSAPVSTGATPAAANGENGNDAGAAAEVKPEPSIKAEEGSKPEPTVKAEEAEPTSKVEADVKAEPQQQGHKRPLEEDEANASAEKKQKLTESEEVGDIVELRSSNGLRKKPEGPYEEPFKYISPEHPVVQDVVKFYSLSSRFPRDRFMVRNALGEPAKAIYYTSALARDVLTANEGKGVKFIHGGVKMFMKQDSPSAEVCRWRIQSEGMPILQGYVGANRVVHLHKKETLRKLLIEMFPKIDEAEKEGLGEIYDRVKEIGMGCCVLRIEPEEGEEEMEPTVLPLWKSFHSLNLMLPKEDRSAMLLRIFNDTTPLVNHGLGGKKKPQDPAAETEGAEAPAANGEATAAAVAEPADDNEQAMMDAAEDAPSE